MFPRYQVQNGARRKMFPGSGTFLKVARFRGLGKACVGARGRFTHGAATMDGRYRDGMAVRREGGTLDVKKEQPDRERVLAARARQRAIGRELRRMYDEIVQEPVPNEFLDILHRIDANQGEKDETA